MFSMDDFEKGNEFYENLKPSYQDMEGFSSLLMVITHAFKNIDYDNLVKSGDVMMMRLFNMTNLSMEDNNEEAFNVVMALLTHIFSMLSFIKDKDEYFQFFDKAVMYPMINDSGNDGKLEK